MSTVERFKGIKTILVAGARLACLAPNLVKQNLSGSSFSYGLARH